MNTMLNLVNRHNKVFRRDRMLVFFSILSVIIVIMLYAIFIQKTQVDAIEQLVPASDQLKTMVNEWMVAGLLSIIAVTTTLAALGIYIKDLETKVMADFLTTPNARAKIQLSYVINSLLIGFVLSLIGLIACQLFIVFMGGSWFTFEKIVQLIGIIALAVTLSSVFNLFLTLLVSTQNAFSTLNTVVGTAIGFLCGVYVPLGAVPDFVQKIIMVFPISHTTVLFREALMRDSLDKVFEGAPEAENTYEIQFGVHYEWNDMIFSPMHSVIYIIASIIVFTLISLWLYGRKNK